MEEREMYELLEAVAGGKISPDEAALRFKTAPFTDLGYAKVDNHRAIRQGAAEVIYGAGKTPEQMAGIIAAMHAAGQRRVLITRLSDTAAKEVQSLLRVSDDALADAFVYYDLARVAVVGGMPEPTVYGRIVIAAAGTSDLPVAEEAALTAEVLGNEVVRLYDVGVAGIHRLLAHTREIASAQVIVAVAGMEGALASVIGGMASCPVIAVPTSVGYGASFGGVAALLAMLNSCASGISVVNIDNGFGAGYQASMINQM